MALSFADRIMPISRLSVALLLTVAALVSPVCAAEPHWIRVSSSRFLVLNDGDEKQGREIALRFEQMRAVFGQLLMRDRVNMPLPIDIVALKNDDDYANTAPTPHGKPIFEAGFAIPGEDREYFVLDLAEPDSWRAISYDFARMLLNYNYPPTQAWFDEGFAEYFASLRLDNKQMQVGEDPESSPPVRQSVLGKPALTSAPPQPLIDLLNKSPWMTLPALFAAKPENSAGSDRQTLFNAQSWMVMHYLINKSKLPETGAYLGMVENDKLPIEEAIQKAYGMSAAQLDQAVKDYFHSVAPLLQTPAGKAPSGPLAPADAPVTYEDVGVSTATVLEAGARSHILEMELRLPERRERARQALEAIVNQPLADTVVAHRGLGWDHLAKGEFDPAADEFATAEQLDPKDGWTRYYMALTKFREARSSGKDVKGLANMMQDLHTVLQAKPEFAEGYYMLGWAQRQGGGIHAATDSARAAIRLAPRNQNYLLEMARVYQAAKQWDAATALLQRLSKGSDAQVAEAARNDLHDLPYLVKYGVAPARQVAASATTPTDRSSVPTGAPTADSTSPAGAPANKPAASLASEPNDEISVTEPQPVVDKRAIHYLKGKLISVDCSQPPAAIVTFSAGAKTLKLRVADYKSLTLIGADTFSCQWSNRQSEINYKAGGTADGDLVSLEVR